MGATNAKYDVQLSPVTSDIDFLTYPRAFLASAALYYAYKLGFNDCRALRSTLCGSIIKKTMHRTCDVDLTSQDSWAR